MASSMQLATLLATVHTFKEKSLECRLFLANFFYQFKKDLILVFKHLEVRIFEENNEKSIFSGI